MENDQQKLQDLRDELQKLQTELQGNVDARQKLESQQQENQAVQKEFAKLDDGANIYKMIGPVLLKQDRTEAVMAVDGRLDFIEKEIVRIEGLIKTCQEFMDEKGSEMYRLQATLQSQQQSAPTAA